MSKTRKIILIIILNITIVLWLTLIYSVLNHKEDESLLNYKSPVEEKTNVKKPETPVDDIKTK